MFLLHTALFPEAKPWIATLGLRVVSGDPPLRLFANENTALVVGGPGKVRAAAAVTFAVGQCESRLGKVTHALNLGLAGDCQGEKTTGKAHVIEKCTDAGGGADFYPDLLFAQPLPLARLHTFDRVMTSRAEVLRAHPDADLVDMEASGFLEAASLFLPPSRAHSVKIVGDRLDDAGAVTARDVEARMAEATESVLRFMEAYHGFVAAAEPVPVLSAGDETILREAGEHLRLTRAQCDRLRRAAHYHRLHHKSPLAEIVGPFLHRPIHHKRERNPAFQHLLDVLHSA